MPDLRESCRDVDAELLWMLEEGRVLYASSHRLRLAIVGVRACDDD